MLEPDNSNISIRRQCELTGASRSTFYYKPEENDDDFFKLLIFEEYKKYPFFGYRKITEALQRKNYDINRKRVYRLMREMGIKAIYPRPNLSKPAPGHKIYPYLLRGLEINRPNQVWATDITYIRLQGGFVYLVAIIDLYSRKVLSWSLSNTLDVQFCLDALDEALLTYGKPEIFNSDQGSQFTSKKFTDLLKENEVKISMDGKGRAQDNIYVERLWRSLKYEDIYIREYNSVSECKEGINRYFNFFNTERFHQSLDYLTPDEMYYSSWDKTWELKKAS
jgi:putative transposase